MELPGLRSAREAALLTQRELAELVGVQRVTINRIETGATQARISTVRRIAEALGVPASVLTGRSGNDAGRMSDTSKRR